MPSRSVLNLRCFSRNFNIYAANVRYGTKLNYCQIFRRNMSQDRMPKNYKTKSTIGYALGGVFATCGYILADYMGITKSEMVPSISATGLYGLREKFNFIADVAEVAAPAVVYVEILDTKRFNHLTGQHVPVSAGSGFVVKPDGLIVTNAHVILQKMSNCSNLKIVVRLPDGRQFDADVESVDREADLATLRIPIKNLPKIKLGRSIGLKPGEFVLALGSPLALTNSVTHGIVSAYRKPEEIGMKKSKAVYIQTDASINNGNSGGPLLNVEGEAIGMNCMNIIPGMSFATPIDLVTIFLKESADEEKRLNIRKQVEEMRYLGVVMLTLNPDIIEELKRIDLEISPKVKFGVLIHRIMTYSPAEK